MAKHVSGSVMSPEHILMGVEFEKEIRRKTFLQAENNLPVRGEVQMTNVKF